MARSTYIYCVFEAGRDDFLCAFTVKHECKSWVENSKDYFHPNARVASYRDGGGTEVVKTWTIDEFLNEK